MVEFLFTKKKDNEKKTTFPKKQRLAGVCVCVCVCVLSLAAQLFRPQVCEVL
jgi:hypothetical protein